MRKEEKKNTLKCFKVNRKNILNNNENIKNIDMN
jgi:hypothetical protein